MAGPERVAIDLIGVGERLVILDEDGKLTLATPAAPG